MSKPVSSLASPHSPIASVLGPFTKPALGSTLGVTVVALDKRSSQFHQARRFIGGSEMPQVSLRSTPFSIGSSVSRSFNKKRQSDATRTCLKR